MRKVRRGVLGECGERLGRGMTPGWRGRRRGGLPLPKSVREGGACGRV